MVVGCGEQKKIPPAGHGKGTYYRPKSAMEKSKSFSSPLFAGDSPLGMGEIEIGSNS